MNFVTELSTALVVERSGLQKLETEEMAAALSDIYSRGKKVVMVDHMTRYFSLRNLAEMLNTPGDESANDLELILEQRGIILSFTEMTLITQFHKLRERILNTAPIGVTTGYPFDEVPDGWTFEDAIVVNTKSVRRRESSNYTVGLKTLERIWKVASQKWAGISDENLIPNIQASGYYNDGHIRKDGITIGCRGITRYELEQTALNLGWEFPKETV